MMNDDKFWPAPVYLELPVPIRAVWDGHPVQVANAGRAGCFCEDNVSETGCFREDDDPRIGLDGDPRIGVRLASELTDFEPLVLWLAAVEGLARRTQRRIELPYPVACEQRWADPNIVALTAVGPDGLWAGYDEDGDPVHDLLPEFRVGVRTEEYLEEIRHATRGWDKRAFWRAVPCSKA